MRRMTGALAQRIIFLSESEKDDPAKIGQSLGLPIASVNRILNNREQSTIRVPDTNRLKAHSVSQQTPAGNGMGHFPKTQSRKKRKTK
jgi:hypothetical protein